MTKNIVIRVSAVQNGGQVQSVEFCNTNSVDVADVIEKLHLSVDNMKMFADGKEVDLGSQLKDGSILTIQRNKVDSGL